MVVRSIEAAFTAFVEDLPDVILMSPLLAPQHEEQIVAHLRAVGVDASHVQLLSIPRFGDGQTPAETKRRFGGLSLKKASNASGNCDPVVFANEVAAYLAQVSPLRQVPHTTSEPAAQKDEETDTLAGLRIEHIEQLLERLDTDSSDPDAGSSPRGTGEAISHEAIPKRDDMTMSTAQEFHAETRESGTSRAPRFLTMDDQIPMPLRALLVEADGCLQMSFMTGGGACAGRTLDLLLSEQGIGEGDRGEQIQQLGKKHPAIAESFLKVLSVVTTNPSGAWDEARVTLAIVILKAISYEIYVLGPERKERATYVIELLERFKAAGKGAGADA